MVILSNWVLTLEYDPPSDILYAQLPDVVEFGATELRHALGQVADHVISYDVKNLLLDSTNVRVASIADGEYRAIVGDFLLRLPRTRLQRFARLNSSPANGEERAVNTVHKIFHSQNAAMAFRSFSDKAAALQWLKLPVQQP